MKKLTAFFWALMCASTASIFVGVGEWLLGGSGVSILLFTAMAGLFRLCWGYSIWLDTHEYVDREIAAQRAIIDEIDLKKQQSMGVAMLLDALSKRPLTHAEPKEHCNKRKDGML